MGTLESGHSRNIKISPNNTRNNKPQTRPFLSFPKGVCWKFHSGEFCAGCRFKHTCLKRGATNPATQCHAKPSVQHASSSGEDRKDPPHLNCGPTPVKPHRLEPILRGYDPAIATYLVNGFRFGFSIRYFGDKFNFRSKNLKSAFENPREVTDKLNKEVLSGRIIGPFDTLPLRIFELPLLAWFLKKFLGNSVSYITCLFRKVLL